MLHIVDKLYTENHTTHTYAYMILLGGRVQHTFCAYFMRGHFSLNSSAWRNSGNFVVPGFQTKKDKEKEDEN
jgi:hypothetical protein